MAEIIQFPGSHGEGQSEGAEDMSKRIKIPSIEMIFQEDQIIVSGDGHDPITVATLKDFMKTNGRSEALKNLECSLAQARGRCITENSFTETARKESLIGLAKHTYVVGRDLNYEYLMDWATDELIRGLGTAQAMIVIENIKLKDQLRGTENHPI